MAKNRNRKFYQKRKDNMQQNNNSNENVSELTPDSILENAKGKFKNVVVIGWEENGNVDIATDVPQYPFLQYILNRVSFQLHVHEMNQRGQKNSDTSSSENTH